MRALALQASAVRILAVRALAVQILAMPVLAVRMLAAVVLVPALLAGCTSTATRAAGTPAPSATGPVPVPVPTSSSAAVRRACARLLATLPAELGADVRRRPVTADPSRVAAWGDPPITLRCGVPRPDLGIEPLTIDGVAWAVTDVGAGQLWTTQDRAVNVAVRIGDEYEGQGELVVPLARPVLAALPPAR